MDIMQRVKNTPECDWPVATRDLAGPGKFFGLYGGEHIAATEFVIGATLVQYGCSALDILIGLALGNLLATLSFALLCAPIATDSRLSLYTYLYRVVGAKVQKIYNLVCGIGFAGLAATGICVSATAVRRILNVPIQNEWYPTSIKFIAIVLVLGTVIVYVAANGFEGVSKFASKCVPWMIILFLLGFVCVLPQLASATGSGEIRSLGDIFNLFSNHVWVEQVPASGKKLGIVHVIGFAWACNVVLHLGLNDMSVLRYARSPKYGYISAVGMFVGHYFAWISAGIMGATAAIMLNTDLGLLDSGEVTYTVLGYAGLLGVIVAGWTTANPLIYRVTLSFNAVFPKFTYKKMAYIAGSMISIAACFPAVQRAADILTYLGILVVGMGAVCIMEHFLFPKIGYTRYWNLYKKQDTNWAALISWGLSLILFAVLFITQPIHQNFWFIPTFLIAAISYVILAGFMGAKEAYPKEEAEEIAYEKALQEYVDQQEPETQPGEMPMAAKALTWISYAALAVMVVTGIIFCMGVVAVESMKLVEFAMTIVYFVCAFASVFISGTIGKK